MPEALTARPEPVVLPLGSGRIEIEADGSMVLDLGDAKGGVDCDEFGNLPPEEQDAYIARLRKNMPEMKRQAREAWAIAHAVHARYRMTQLRHAVKIAPPCRVVRARTRERRAAVTRCRATRAGPSRSTGGDEPPLPEPITARWVA
jgi:hypothetical protein